MAEDQIIPDPQTRITKARFSISFPLHHHPTQPRRRSLEPDWAKSCDENLLPNTNFKIISVCSKVVEYPPSDFSGRGGGFFSFFFSYFITVIEGHIGFWKEVRYGAASDKWGSLQYCARVRVIAPCWCKSRMLVSGIYTAISALGGIFLGCR